MDLIYKNGKVEIWRVSESYGFDFYVYGLHSDPVVCPSEGMAREMAVGAQ